MKKFKTYLLVLVAILVAVSMLAGCGSDGETEATKAPTAAATEKPTTAPTQAPTEVPTQAPTEAPTEAPTKAPITPNDPPEGYNAEDKAPAADLFDLVFDGETAKDNSASQFEITDLNDPIVGEDKEIGKTVADFDKVDASMYAVYDFNKDVHDKLSDGFTFETYVKLYDDTSYCGILAYTQSGGASIDFDEAKGAIGFGIRSSSGFVYVYDTERVSTDEYYHVVGVYDGETVSLYYDGELIGTSAAGAIIFPSIENTYLGVGGDLSDTDQGEDQMTGSIAIARVYSEPLNASQVYNLYLDAIK